MDLKQIRNQIDEIDASFVELFEKRMELVNQVAEYKLKTGMQVLDSEREKVKIERARDAAHGDFNKQGAAEIFHQLMAISRKWQYRMIQEHEDQAKADEEASGTERNDSLTEKTNVGQTVDPVGKTQMTDADPAGKTQMTDADPAGKTQTAEADAAGHVTDDKEEHYRTVDYFDFTGCTAAYCGIPGAFAHQALHGYFGDDMKELSVASFRQAMQAIYEGAADYAVLPIENTSAGIVNDVYDLLVEYDNYIIDTYDLPIRHSLLGVPGAKIEDIRYVYSHPQAIMQCGKYLGEHLQWGTIRTDNTAVSARAVAEDGDRTHAAIASVATAKLYGLDVLEENIQTNDNNMTRFIIASREPAYRKGASRTILCFVGPHEEGSLYNLLSHFVYNHLNMTKIESRPIQGQKWQYRFYVEIEGNLGDAGVKNALRGIREEAIEMKLLGSY
ncbi:MAG: bifunctional chorismate mutase/prephenate dehydratase [Lachnospiraceae bacterium]|nr:bifunctional chorismate mutase/prephenate dehydratase [Lachnospiraceae bacterium]